MAPRGKTIIYDVMPVPGREQFLSGAFFCVSAGNEPYRFPQNKKCAGVEGRIVACMFCFKEFYELTHNNLIFAFL